MASKSPILFVHGMFMTGASWRGWKAHFESLGHRCLTPSWPGREGGPAALRATPDGALSSLSLGDVVQAMRSVVETLDEPPILIGHSMGGLVVQLLAQEGLGSRVVAIAPAPPFGVRSFALSHLRSNAAMLAPTNAPIRPTPAWFRYAFAHLVPDDEARALFDRDVVPESRRVGRGPLGKESEIDFGRTTAPMLFLAGEADRIIPAGLVEKVAARYRQADAATRYSAMAGRTHSLVTDARWPEVAARVEAWLA